MVEDQKLENPESIIQAAILHERMQNPYCPIADLLEELLEINRQGDESAIELALEIAHESLTPRKPNFVDKIVGFIRNWKI